jgi:hypothetical protein
MADLANRLAHLGGGFVGKLRARRERLSGHRGYLGEPGRWSVRRRSPILLGWGLCVVLNLWSVTSIILDIRGRPAPPEPRNAALVKAASRAAASGITVPDVRGMPASDARAQLERVGLKFARAKATVGTPGQVLWTEPAIGHMVPSDTPVTIFVGVGAERFVLETSGL